MYEKKLNENFDHLPQNGLKIWTISTDILSIVGGFTRFQKLNRSFIFLCELSRYLFTGSSSPLLSATVL